MVINRVLFVYKVKVWLSTACCLSTKYRCSNQLCVLEVNFVKFQLIHYDCTTTVKLTILFILLTSSQTIQSQCIYSLFMQNESRRFRVKFAASSHSSGTEQCSWCVALLQHHFHVKKMNLDGSTDDTSMQVQNLLMFCLPSVRCKPTYFGNYDFCICLIKLVGSKFAIWHIYIVFY